MHKSDNSNELANILGIANKQLNSMIVLHVLCGITGELMLKYDTNIGEEAYGEQKQAVEMVIKSNPELGEYVEQVRNIVESRITEITKTSDEGETAANICKFIYAVLYSACMTHIKTVNDIAVTSALQKIQPYDGMVN